MVSAKQFIEVIRQIITEKNCKPHVSYFLIDQTSPKDFMVKLFNDGEVIAGIPFHFGTKGHKCVTIRHLVIQLLFINKC